MSGEMKVASDPLQPPLERLLADGLGPGGEGHAPGGRW